MSVWEKTLINLQKGYEKLMAFASVFSERVKAEVNIIRVRMQMDDVRGAIREQQQFIGRRILELRETDALPRSFDLFFKSEEVAGALERIAKLTRDLENLEEELKGEQAAAKPAPPKGGETPA